jgi:dTMP kinase
MDVIRGRLIAIEGLEGAGKSTAVELISDLLTQKKIKFHTTREPGGTAVGEQLRAILKNPAYKNILDDRCELLLMYASRIQLVKEVIEPALSRGEWVVADRFELSTLAYQGGGRGLDLEMLRHLSAFCLQGLKPDLTLYLDLDPEIGMQRVHTRGATDRIEQQHIDFFHRVHQTYLREIESDPSTQRIDASLSRDEVQQYTTKIINLFIEQYYAR